ncbi:hypothetical protein BSKO_10011 [Bryopsis sp. KO-2023]|nr:hypothetical protein BSKO_10011 [Bryopsis sp. KO-2023]
MWSGLDLSKLGQALEKVRKEVDQAVDTALGVDEASKLQRQIDAGEEIPQEAGPPRSSAAKEFNEVALDSTSPQHETEPSAISSEARQIVSGGLRSPSTQHALDRAGGDHCASVEQIPPTEIVEALITLHPGTQECSLALSVHGGSQSGEHARDSTEKFDRSNGSNLKNGGEFEQRCGPLRADLGNLEGGVDVATEVASLRDSLAVREKQLERQAEQMAQLRDVQAQLQDKNEQLAMRSAKVSEDDLEAIKRECDLKVQAAERKVYAVTKERDALKRGSEKLTSASELLKEKDEIIQEVMAEGEKLSKKQLELESALKKRKTQVKDLEAAHEKLASQLTEALGRVEELTLEKSELVKNLQSTEDVQKDRLEKERLQFEALLKDARTAQVEAEQAANAAAKQGLTQQIRDANAQIQALSETNTDLTITLSRLRSEADEKERALKEEVAALERKCESAEARHEDLAAKFPEATQPLVRQLEVLQADANARAEAWSIAEMSMMEQLESAESQASFAQGKERMATRRLQSLQDQFSALESSVSDLRAQLTDSMERCDRYKEELASAATRHSELEGKLTKNEELLNEQQRNNDEVHRGLQEKLSAERSRRQEAEKRIQDVQANMEKQLKQAGNGNHRQNLSKKAEQFGHDRSENGTSGGEELTRLPLSVMEGNDVDRLKALLRSRQRECDRMSKQLLSLESTRDRLSGELVAESQRYSKAQLELMELKDVESQLKNLQGRYNACVELLGEREERLAELEADLQDVKELYRDQISFMAEELTRAQSEYGDV